MAHLIHPKASPHNQTQHQHSPKNSPTAPTHPWGLFQKAGSVTYLVVVTPEKVANLPKEEHLGFVLPGDRTLLLEGLPLTPSQPTLG